MSHAHQDITQLAENIIDKARQKTVMIALAESCTGGMIAAALTDISGSSAALDRGFVTYSNQAKIDILRVSNATLEQYGAVSEQTARAMVDGTLIAAPMAGLALSVTGIAGPGGGGPGGGGPGGGGQDKPVGLVHFACQRRDAPQTHAMHIFSGDRHMVRQQAVRTALMMIADALA
ncbi:MAG: CinA family protein [Alphaproteobacteria bacterium]